MSMKMFVWSDHFSFLAVAQAESVAKAREAMLVEMGESGDGSCPERDKARQQILSENPTIWQGVNAEFALSDSAEVREQEAFAQRLQQQLVAKTKEIELQKATITGLSARLADERGAREAVERANAELRARMKASEAALAAARTFCETTRSEMDGLEGSTSLDIPVEFMALHDAIVGLAKFDEQQTAAAGGTHEAEKGRAQIIGDSV